MELTQLCFEFPVSLFFDLVFKDVDPREDLDGLDILKAFGEHAHTFLLGFHVLLLQFRILCLNTQINYKTKEKDAEAHDEYKAYVFVQVKEASQKQQRNPHQGWRSNTEEIGLLYINLDEGDQISCLKPMVCSR